MDMNNVPLRPRTYGLLAFIACIIGLTSSIITAKFFIIGLERMEADTDARQALIAAGILIVVTELAAFGLAALLPRQTLQGLRVRLMLCGALLLSFEAVTIYMTQATLVQASNTVATANTTRITNLRISIDNQRSAAKGLRDGGSLQSASTNAWTRHLGAVALGNALEVEKNIMPLTQELASLESTTQPTMTDILGTHGMLAYTVARAMLISIMGLVMFGAAGALLRAARSAAYVGNTATVEPSVTVRPSVTVEPASYQHGVTTAPKGLSAYLPSLRFVAAPLAALAVSPAAFAAPNMPTVTTVTAMLQGELQPQGGLQLQSELQYQRVRNGVMAGHIKPSVRGIQSQAGGGTAAVRRYLQRLETEGVITRSGQGWIKNPYKLAEESA